MRPQFARRDGVLHAESLPLPAIAAQVPTPFYCYSAAALRANYAAFAAAFGPLEAKICYAVKANANQAVLTVLARAGAGADIVSGGELKRALAAGIAADRIVFSGVGKSRAEIAAALAAGIHQFNAESLPELQAISDAAQECGRDAAVALRVNPDIDPLTHAKIATGHRETKFGIERAQLDEALRLAASLPRLKLTGLAMHIGSQLTDVAPCRDAFAVMADLVRAGRRRGLDLARLDLGGGFAIRYNDETVPPLTEFAQAMRDTLAPLGCALTIEPGRALVGAAGILVSRVLVAKRGVTKNFLILDAAMNDLIRPALYDAYHEIVPVAATDAPPEVWDVAGPVCETGDLFAAGRMLPPLPAGELVAILDAGAYGAVMGSTYNARPLTAEVLVDGSRFAPVRRAVGIDEQMSWENLPAWLQ